VSAPTSHLWSLVNWLDRLGIQSQVMPAIITAIQPTQLVSDASELTPPLRAPTGWVGGEITAAALQFPGLAVKSIAPGGTFLHNLNITSNTTQTLTWEHSLTDPVFAASTLLTPRGIDFAFPPTAQARIGSVAVVLPPANRPSMRLTSGRSYPIGHERAIWIPPGSSFFAVFTSAASVAQFSVEVQDVPVALAT